MHQLPVGIVIRTDLRVSYITFELEVFLEEASAELVLLY